MKPLRLPALFVIGLVVGLNNVDAYEANKRRRLPPDAQLKVNKAIARSYREGETHTDEALRKGQSGLPRGGCGNLSVGSVGAPRAARVEQVTVVRGDVININRNTDCR